ncbi:MAG: RPA family protein [Methermicoccaceae archaeon]
MALRMKREVARRVFSQEFNESDLSYKKGDDKYSPKYVLTPTGAEVNRLFLVGALTEREDVGVEVEYWRGRVVDPTGVFSIYAGQYQPEAMHALAGIEPPAFVAVVGKVSTYTLEGGDTRTSIRPEFLSEVEEDVRDRWVLETAVQTLDRLDCILQRSSECAKHAQEYYHTDVVYYAKMVHDALSTISVAKPSAKPKREEPPRKEPPRATPEAQEQEKPKGEPEPLVKTLESELEESDYEEFDLEFDEVDELDI